MGADMCATALALRAERLPDWAAGAQAIDELTAEPLIWLADDLGFDPDLDMKQRLRCALENARRAVEGRDRECTQLRFGAWTLFVSGGMSTGDAPTDLYDHFALLDVSGVARSIGFDWPSAGHHQAPVAPFETAVSREGAS
jgi:hypothetical protein